MFEPSSGRLDIFGCIKSAENDQNLSPKRYLVTQRSYCTALMLEGGRDLVGATRCRKGECSECENTRKLPLVGILPLSKWDVPVGKTSRATD